ncbi:MAG: DUF4118 domain-containing protein [Acidobacteria bacterium]|nr:DUF4118 domain-containing protein [Acidobacteriota bacterium]
MDRSLAESGTRRRVLGYASAAVIVGAATIVFLPFREVVNAVAISLGFLLTVLAVASLFGSGPALVTSLLAAFCLNFFFLPPYYTLRIDEPQNWIALVVFLIVAATVGQLSAKARHRADVAEKLYDDLQKAFEQASQAEAIRRSEKLKSALLDAVTHDLRTPLTSIKAATTMLIAEQDAIHSTLEPTGHADLLEVINEETDRLNSFVESMVELARLDAGNFELKTAVISVEELLANVLQRASRVTRDHVIDVDIAPDLPPLRADAKAIAEALYNLIDNAAKYSAPKSTIRISASRSHGGMRFTVADEGRGIPPDERERVFEKFYRSDHSAKGFGLGLPIVRGIVEAHLGRVFVDDSDKGAKFVIELPIER